MNARAPLAPAVPLSHQSVAADPGLSVFVTANAGSGKTTTLVNRVARLLLRGALPEALLCVTYTKAAAAEMQTRLFETLGGWAVMDDRALTAALAKIDEEGADLARARTLFARALETPGGLKIQTIHAFCEKLLRRFPLEAGVAPGFEVLEDAAAAAVSARAREAVALHALRAPDGAVGQAYAHFAVALDFKTFEGLFRRFESERTGLIAFAEAGGAERVWRDCGFDGPCDPRALEAEAAGACEWARWADAAQALAATGKSSDVELSQRLAALAECAADTTHGFDDCLAVFSTQGGEKLKRLGTKGVDPDALAWLLEEQERLHEVCARAKAAHVARDTAHALALAGAYAKAYAVEKAATGALDFADLIAAVRTLITERADAAWVLYKLDGGIEHILVDEAQDTAPEQWDILRALTEEFFAGAGARPSLRPRTVFAVGDEKQSIYSFQGARPERLLAETQAYDLLVTGAGAEFRVVPLTDSWRSTPQVLGFVDAVFTNAATHGVVPGPAGAVVGHTARRLDHAGCVDLWPLEQDEAAPEPDAWDAPLDATPPESAAKRLARRIAFWVRDAGARDEAIWDKERKMWRPVRPGDVLILVRKRGPLFEEIIRALKKANVPVAGADRLTLSDHILFQDLLSLCRFVLYPDDDLSLATLLRSPFCDVDEDSLFDLAYGRQGSLWRTLRARSEERPAWRDAHALLTRLADEARHRQPFDWLARALGVQDPAGRTLRRRILTRLGREAEDALDEVLAQALSLEARGVRDLERFTAALEASELQVKRELEGAAGEVRVMTVHGAKGLEAPVVILPDGTTGPRAPRECLLKTEAGGYLFAPRKADDCAPSADARDYAKQREEEESLRLLYVALTRARDRLIVCGRIAVNRKGADPTSWYAFAQAAFDRPEVAAQAREVTVGEMTARRFGPDPTLAPADAGALSVTTAPPAWTRAAAPEETPALDYASPSDLAERRRGSAPSPLMAAGGVGRFRRGDLIHRLLQLLPDLPAEQHEAAAARLLGKERDLSDDQRAEMAAAALAVLRDPVFAEVFGPGSRAEAAVAGHAPHLPPGLAVSGRVDRMLVTPDRVLVVDFKTNRQAPRRVEDADEAYRIQMAVYVAVLRAIFPGRRVEAALVWTDGPRLMPVPDDVIAAALAGLARRS